MVNRDGVKPLAKRVEAIRNFVKLATVKLLRRFLGMVNFYHRFIPGAVNLLKTSNDLLKGSKKGNVPVPWAEAAEEAFVKVKDALASATILVHPVSGAHINITVDASDYAIGVVLQQLVNDVWKPLSFYTKALSAAQCKYSAYDRDLLTIYVAVKRLRYSVERHDFVIYADHKPLICVKSYKARCNPYC